MLLTFVVWVYMYIRRLHYMLTHGVSSNSVATPELLNSLLPEHINRPSNNLKNLFELPVLFYVLCISLVVLQIEDTSFVNLAWVYVALRAIHSLIHCTINIVLARFIAYLLSSLTLWLMVAKFATVVL